MRSNALDISRWPETNPPEPHAVEKRMRSEHLSYYRWSNGPGDVYGAHDHGYDKIIYVVTGSITFGLPDHDRKITMHAGDRLYLPAGTTHDALVGNGGVVCLEAHQSA